MSDRRIYPPYLTGPIHVCIGAKIRADKGMHGVWGGSGIVHSNPTRSAETAPPIQGCRGGACGIAPETPKIAPGDVKISSMETNQEQAKTTGRTDFSMATPDASDVRYGFVERDGGQFWSDLRERRGAAFDRWLERHDAELVNAATSDAELVLREQIEAAAKALYKGSTGFKLTKGKPWSELSESTRETQLEYVRIAFRAAGFAIEEAGA